MAGKITVTNYTMVKEVPVLPVLQPATALTTGYISVTTISFAKSAAATPVYSIDDSGNGIVAAGFTGCDGEMILVECVNGADPDGVNDGLYTIVSDEIGQLVVIEPVITQTAAAAGTVTVTGVAVYKITPTKEAGKLLIVYSEGVEAEGEIGMVPCAINGVFWAAKSTLYTAFAATTVIDSTYYLFIETAPYMQADGTIMVMLKPVTGGTTDDLYTDHRPALSFIELP